MSYLLCITCITYIAYINFIYIAYIIYIYINFIYITYTTDIFDISPERPLQCHLHRSHCTGVVTQELLHRSCSTANTHLADDIWLQFGPNIEDLLDMLAPCKSPEPLPLIQSVFLAMPCDHVVTASKWKKPPARWICWHHGTWGLRQKTLSTHRSIRSQVHCRGSSWLRAAPCRRRGPKRFPCWCWKATFGILWPKWRPLASFDLVSTQTSIFSDVVSIRSATKRFHLLRETKGGAFVSIRRFMTSRSLHAEVTWSWSVLNFSGPFKSCPDVTWCHHMSRAQGLEEASFFGLCILFEDLLGWWR